MELFHATTPAKARRYRETGRIIKPVRGFTTEKAAMAWAMKVGRKVIISFHSVGAHKLPDHHNKFGDAYWQDSDVTEWKCIFNAENA